MRRNRRSIEPSEQIAELLRLRDSERITESEFQRRFSQILSEYEAARKQDETLKELKEALKTIDRKYATRSKFIAQGGLPSLGKRRP